MMQLNQLERIVLVAETGNITEAAERLHISQPSLSQMISSVEREIGAPIFNRRAWPLQLTDEGRCFVRTAKQIIGANEAMMEEIHCLKTGSGGKITIGTSIPRCRYLLSCVIPEMSKRHPNITLHLVDGKSADFENMILFGSVDMAFSNIPPNSPQVSSRLLNEERYYLVANNMSAFARRLNAIRDREGRNDYRFALREVENESLILLNPHRSSRIVFNKMLQEDPFTPHIAIEAFNSDVALEYVEMNYGVALLACAQSNLVPFSYRSETISYFELESCYASRELYLFYDETAMASLPKKFMAELILMHFARDGEKTITDIC